ncbi:unnamed protein product [Adineta ricciae]|uniref:Uncharacterized protein n=1 Tax=Adineta ricciae TaxID=249248 RepID=A0A815XZ55_ADIRI|nr:unnamed protein product [Adineta ricciae]
MDRFIHLQSLSLNHISCIGTLTSTISACQSLRYFTHLFISDCSLDQNQQRQIVNLFNNIWSIPSLIHCDLDGIEVSHISFANCILFSQPSSIRHLLIKNIPCDFHNLSALLTLFTPHVEQLSTKIYCQSVHDTFASVVPSLRSLQLFFRGGGKSLRSLVSHFPNLRQLTIETLDLHLDGYQWQDILCTDVYNVEEFHLKMQMELAGNDEEVENTVDQLVDSFRTKYWIDKRRWFVRCDWQSSEITTHAYLYTLPYAFAGIDYWNEYQTKSTCSDEETKNCCSYDRVEMFTNNHRQSMSLYDIKLICDRYRRLHFLDVVLPCEMEWSNTRGMQFVDLVSLTVRIQVSSGYDQLQCLCNASRRLYCLRIVFWRKCVAKLCDLQSTSVRRVELSGMMNWSGAFDRDECVLFCRSSLGQQCEVLKIEVEDRRCVVDLLEEMSNIRLLSVRCRDDRWNGRKGSSTESEMIFWLAKHLRTRNIITRNVYRSSYIDIWIDEEEKREGRKYKETKSLEGGHKIEQLLTSIQKLLRKK